MLLELLLQILFQTFRAILPAPRSPLLLLAVFPPSLTPHLLHLHFYVLQFRNERVSHLLKFLYLFYQSLLLFFLISLIPFFLLLIFVIITLIFRIILLCFNDFLDYLRSTVQFWRKIAWRESFPTDPLVVLDILETNSQWGVLFNHFFKEIPEGIINFKSLENLPERFFISGCYSPVIGVFELGRTKWRTFCKHKEERNTRWKYIGLGTIITFLRIIEKFRSVILLWANIVCLSQYQWGIMI